jgi:hypothetical protein
MLMERWWCRTNYLDAEPERRELDDDCSHLPHRERIVDRLADVLLDLDEVLQMLNVEEANGMLWLDPHLRNACDEVDVVMQKLTD